MATELNVQVIQKLGEYSIQMNKLLKLIVCSLFLSGSVVIYILGHTIPEIRQRALEYIRKKFENEIVLHYNAPMLMKWLIRWFGNRPLFNEDVVLELIRKILNVSITAMVTLRIPLINIYYTLHFEKGTFKLEVIKTLGLPNLRKQFEKIDHLLHDPMYKAVLFEIMTALDLFDSEHNIVFDNGKDPVDNSGSDCNLSIKSNNTAGSGDKRFCMHC